MREEVILGARHPRNRQAQASIVPLNISLMGQSDNTKES